MEQFFGKYQVKQEIGRGAMGSVYLAFDTVIQREVAIKTISSTIREKNLKERFIREARAAGKLCHNNIVTIYDFGTEGDRLFIAMEYLEGRDLYQVIAERSPMDVKIKLEIIRQICLGLDYAHQNEVYHRDIKPANVRLLNDGSIKIVDFGLAVMQTSSLTQSGAFLGTPNYVAPERLAGISGNNLSDQFAVGIVFYELLTYTRAFTGDSISTVISNVLNGEPKGLDTGLVAKYPLLQAILQRSIMKKPKHRYPSLKDMADDIQVLLEQMKADSFFMEQPIPVADQLMETIVTSTDNISTSKLISSDFLSTKKRPRKPVLVTAAIVVFIAVLVGVFVLVSGTKDKPLPVPVSANVGYLSFDVKPYAEIIGLENIETGKGIALPGGDGRITPLRLKLPPGKYRVSYSHPSWNGGDRSKVVSITSGETVNASDHIDNRFVEGATLHFLLQAPNEKQ